MVTRRPSRRIASTCSGHWSMATTSRPASIRLAAMQEPLAPVPRTAMWGEDMVGIYSASPALEHPPLEGALHKNPTRLAALATLPTRGRVTERVGRFVHRTR